MRHSQEVAVVPSRLHEGVDTRRGCKDGAAPLARLRSVMWEDVGVVRVRSGLDRNVSELFDIVKAVGTLNDGYFSFRSVTDTINPQRPEVASAPPSARGIHLSKKQTDINITI